MYSIFIVIDIYVHMSPYQLPYRNETQEQNWVQLVYIINRVDGHLYVDIDQAAEVDSISTQHWFIPGN